MKWYLSMGIKKENLRAREIPKEDRAHYAKAQVDIEYKFPFGWQEIEGIHNRGDWDLSNHSKFSKKDLSYFDETTKEKYMPHEDHFSGSPGDFEPVDEDEYKEALRLAKTVVIWAGKNI